MFRFVSAAVLVTLLLFPAGLLPAEQNNKTFRAGAYAMNIVPRKFPVSVNGGMTDRQADRAFDPLHARCLVLDDGSTRIAIVVCDSCMIPRPVLDEAKRLAAKLTGIPADKMLISATHTHTAPTLGGVFQSDPDPDYVKYLPHRIAEGIARAQSNLAPAKIGWAVGRDPAQVFNRRWKMKPGTITPNPFGSIDQVQMNPGYQAKGLIEPAGLTDPEVSVLSLRSPEGRPIALLANYSLHYVGNVPALSADYFALFAERIGQLLGADKTRPSFVGIMSNGTSGDINNINFAGPAPKRQEAYEQARLVADSVARAAHKAYQTIEYKDWVELAMAQKEIELAVRLPGEADVDRAHDILANAKRPLRTLPEVYARETVLLSRYPATVKAIVQAIRIGELGIAASPCETFVEIGLEIKKKSRLRPTFTIELANGYNGYLPTPEQHKLGGYETWRARSSYLEVDAATKITTAILELLNRVR
jgi:neutral ceramidase